MVVYVDLVFLTNLAVDGTVLLATARARRLRPSRARLAAASALGAAYAAAMFWINVPYLYTLGAKVLVSGLMVLLAFGYGGPLAYFRTFGVFYTVNFVTLGGVIGIGSLLQFAGSPLGGLSVTREGGIVLDWKMQLGLFAAALVLSLRLFQGTSKVREKRADTDSLVWRAEIRVGGETWNVPALLDTGNRLYEPLTRIPVMIVEAELWRTRLPPGWCERLQRESADRLISELDDAAREAFPWLDRLRLVPYRGVNGSSRLMLAVKPDAVTLSRADEPPIACSRVLIGLDGGRLSQEGAYRAILHPDLIPAGSERPAPSQPA